jgi:glycosyltransferase involved in cell wall biosynthesis/predicted metal-dependent phosphoesterase TrpH
VDTLHARCDLHVHSLHSRDSGNFAVRRARVGESYTTPARVHDTCVRRGMSLVTISDHNTLEGALRIADRPNTFLSEEVTTRFPEDDVPLHVLVWNLTEEDHRELQELRPSVYALVDFLIARRLAHALAHPLYRMGPPLTRGHVERLMLLFKVWEVRNGARPASSNLLAEALRSACTPAYLATLADRHGLEPRHSGAIAPCAGSDDHGALDIATTWTVAPGDSPATFLANVAGGSGVVCGEHGSSLKLAHAVGALLVNAYRDSGRRIPEPLEQALAPYFDEPVDGTDRHDRLIATSSALARRLAASAREGAFDLDQLPSLGGKLGALLLAGTIEAPFVASVRHHAQTRVGVKELGAEFFGISEAAAEPRALVFTDTFHETNGVALTMRRLAALEAPLQVITCGPPNDHEPVVTFPPDWSVPLPAYETIELNVPSLTEVIAYVEREDPDVVHVATPGPVGLCGLAAAKVLSIPVVGSYHTEFGLQALRLTQDLLVSEALDRFVDWFYRQCSLVLGPTKAVANALEQKGLEGRTAVWGRGVDSSLFTPARRDDDTRAQLLDGREVLALYVGRVSSDKRVEILLEAARLIERTGPDVRFVVAGDGPACELLAGEAPPNTTFVGEVHGAELARLYASADVFCFPSTTDTFGQVLLEAAASGLPVIAAAAGGALELVEGGETGMLVPPDDPAALADAVRSLARHPHRRALLAAAARTRALEHTWERSLEELRTSYELVSRRSPRSSVLAAA